MFPHRGRWRRRAGCSGPRRARRGMMEVAGPDTGRRRSEACKRSFPHRFPR
ncbi:MAG: hypothetical protein OZSIB_2542 [Candidatus Ozemobacter sibiricus]|uniref:Uncharacterized protein n=1 Tax=Candidatus Ozemobacter sibiricus TaxID=2268124 RepID=A0A367ZSP1_9BACT|nr:MAG: hypothetical protein OZSIB_2542 [Candidatus Ozemobacter sibiricus]